MHVHMGKADFCTEGSALSVTHVATCKCCWLAQLIGGAESSLRQIALCGELLSALSEGYEAHKLSLLLSTVIYVHVIFPLRSLVLYYVYLIGRGPLRKKSRVASYPQNPSGSDSSTDTGKGRSWVMWCRRTLSFHPKLTLVLEFAPCLNMLFLSHNALAVCINNMVWTKLISMRHKCHLLQWKELSSKANALSLRRGMGPQ